MRVRGKNDWESPRSHAPIPNAAMGSALIKCFSK